MEVKLTERQQRFIDLAAAHAEDFKTRVAQHDRDNTFPFENIEALKKSGYSALTVPEELGGSGANVLELALAQERLGRGDAPTAVGINMHRLLVSTLADMWRLGAKEWAPLLESLARDRIIFAIPINDPKLHSTTGIGGFNDAAGRRAEKVDGGYVVNGRSGFGTMSACADYMISTAHYDDPEKGPQCLLFFLPAKTPGIKIQNNWDTMTIRASLSNDVVWDNVFVPETAAVLRVAREWDTFFKVAMCWAVPCLDACYLGLAQAARDYAIGWVGERQQVPFDRPMSHYPGNQFLAAEMEIGLQAARAMLIQTATAVNDLSVRPNPPMTTLIACRQFVPESVVQVVDKAMRMVGGAALYRANPLEQMYRDIRAAIIHQPFAGHDGLGVLGKLLFGISHDTMPRWA
ncbi:MAG: acyl-CoA dehydrogenase family protein [Candidatus Binatia bacterium]